MKNRLFSLIVIPDSGSEVKSSSFNIKFVLWSISGLITMFFVCLFFIVGYHIKLNQEKEYNAAVDKYRVLCSQIEESGETYLAMSDRLSKVQQNDKAFRNFNSMKVYDTEAYQAGIGGHSFIDTTLYNGLDDLRIDLENLDYGIISTENRINLLESSFSEIGETVKKNRDIFNNTPSILPTRSVRFSDRYGWRTHPVTGRHEFHNGLDICGYVGQDIFATADGEVAFAGYSGPLGRCVKIKHKYGYVTTYGHLNRIGVVKGQKVSKGDVIGELGRTGRATGYHIHYAISLNGRSQNPLDYF